MIKPKRLAATRWIHILLICLLFPVVGHATPKQLMTILASIHTFSANFQQKIISTQGRVLQTSTGKVAIQRPGKLRWETITPSPQLIITNNNRAWIYDKGLEQVIIKKLKRGIGNIPAMLLTHPTVTLLRQYKIKQVKQSFILTPKNSQKLFSKIILNFKNTTLKSMSLIDALGQTTVVQFVKIRENIPLNPDLFHFKPPAGVDIIDETK